MEDPEKPCSDTPEANEDHTKFCAGTHGRVQRVHQSLLIGQIYPERK
jgi:hypothetical protein